MYKQILIIFFISFSLYADSEYRPDAHAPIGVMGDHLHKKGEFMLSYRFMSMRMQGNRDGTSDLSTEEVLDSYMVAPTKMDMDMHMLGAMYAPSDTFTLMLMLPYIENSMEHTTRMGTNFKTESEGLGDIKLSGLIRLYKDSKNHFHFNAGISLPTGDIDEKDDLPIGSDKKLPYPMQLGSGTYDLMPGITYLRQFKTFSVGAQGSSIFRLAENDNDYTLGDVYQGTLWGSYVLSDWVSTSIRLNWLTWENIDGRDKDLNPMMVATADSNKRAGDRLDLGFGMNLYVQEGLLKASRFAAEFILPIYQSLDGPQLEQDWQFILGWQRTV